MNDSHRVLKQFSLIALTEGWSYILLLVIAMPLKYLAGIPEAVKFTGWIHGVLFMGYGIWLLRCAIAYSWKFTFMLWAFIASLIPFGTFVLDKQLMQRYPGFKK